MTDEFTEKRIHPRVNFHLGISYSAFSEPMVICETDVSKGGIFIHTEEPCNVGTEIQLGLHLPGADRPLNATGRVVRVVMPGQGEPCGMGVELLRMPPEDKKILYKHLDDLLLEEVKVVLVTKDEYLMKLAKRLLEDQGNRVMWIQEWRDLAGIVKKEKIDLVVCDICSDEMDPGVLKTTAAGRPLLIICDGFSPKVQQRAFELGLYEILEKPIDPERFTSSVESVMERGKTEVDALEQLPDMVFEDMPLVAISPAMRKVVKQIPKYAFAALPLLITGQGGTGKRMVVNLVRALGPRKDKPFVVVDCTHFAGWNKDRLISKLFGHEKEAFTGATRMRKGSIELAEGGIWFLDEIGDLPVECQRQLYRVVEEQTFSRLGGNREIPCNVRVMAATSRKIMDMTRKGEFEPSLYYRLCYHSIHVPSLKNRREDIVPLAIKYLERLRKEGRTHVKYISPEVRNKLIAYDWPGNVRELWGVIENSVVEVDPEFDTLDHVVMQSEFSVDDTLPRFVISDHVAPDTSKKLKDYLKEVYDQAERKYLVECLKETRGNVREAAKIAGIERQSFYRLMKKHGITGDDYEK